MRVVATLAAVLLTAACTDMSTEPNTAVIKLDSPDKLANVFFDRAFEERIGMSPMTLSTLGRKERYDEWDDFSDAQAQRTFAMAQRQLGELRDLVDYDALSAEGQLSHDLFTKELQRIIDRHPYRFHNYLFDQMRGFQSSLPAFMISIHRISDVDDAKAYIARLNGLGAAFDQLIEGMVVRAAKGIIAPRFVFDHVITDCQNILRGRPFEAADTDSTLMADFRAKVGALDLDPDTEQELLDAASTALEGVVGPAYRRLIIAVEAIQARSNTDDGAWKLPDGQAFYALALNQTTTTNLSAAEIHELGLQEVERIHDEMRAIMAKVEFGGSLQEFFRFMATDEQFYFPNDAEGRKEYLTQATALIDNMRNDLPKLFNVGPKAELSVKAVEPFREQSAGKAFYQRPAPDGSRPGIYYANLFRMSDMPLYQMEALAYHEGIPGHHMQIAIAQELEDLPKFRRFGRYTAYTEGWGLYSELLPKEIGRYADPYSDFGRLAMELWRACRLVVDTGIHDKRWNREKAIDYLATNTPNPRNDIVKAVERYIVMPSQATAYKIGMLEILRQRQRAQAALGEAYDIRDFHDAVLRSGPVPLDTLAKLIDEYIDTHP